VAAAAPPAAQSVALLRRPSEVRRLRGSIAGTTAARPTARLGALEVGAVGLRAFRTRLRTRPYVV
jgi:hypothetical protein